MYIFKCPICGKECIYFYGLLCHYRNKHNFGATKYCPLCNSKVKGYMDFIQHCRDEGLKGDVFHGLIYLCSVRPNHKKYRREVKQAIIEKVRCKSGKSKVRTEGLLPPAPQ